LRPGRHLDEGRRMTFCVLRNALYGFFASPCVAVFL